MSPPRLEAALALLLDLDLVDEVELRTRAERWDREQPNAPAERFLEDLSAAGLLKARQARALQRMLPAAQAESTVDMQADPIVGQAFGDYVAEAKLGAGGMGVVYRARRAGDDTPYVIKLFHTAEDPDAAARIEREGELMRALQHPNILRLHATGNARGRPYLILEYVEGQTLHERLLERKRLPWSSATRAAEQIAQALQVAHLAGVIHRDVKPQNLLVDAEGTLKLADFGVAKALEADGMRSRAGQILGSPAYIAPEQWGDHEVDERVDLFALGVIYYQLLTGVTPFRGRSPTEYALRIQTGDYDAIERLAPDVPPGVRLLVRQLLERDRRYRTPSATVVLAEIQRVLRGQLPDIPRLDPQLPGTMPVPLLDKPLFVVGSAEGSDVVLAHPGVEPQHAQLERRQAGLLLRRLTPQAALTVNGQQVGEEVVLKHGDVLGFGDAPQLRYEEGNLAAPANVSWDATASGEFLLPEGDTGVLEPLVLQPLVVPGVLAAALEDSGDPLAILLCIEALDQRGNARVLRRSLLRAQAAGLDPAACETARQHAQRLLAQRASWLGDQLFHVTHENLGEDAQAWVAWWLESRHRHEVQVRPPVPRAGGALVLRGETLPAPRRFPLDDGEEWTIGRSLQAEISVSDRSLSRMHVRVIRLIRRLAFRDLGSRLGVRQGGVRAEAGLLDPERQLQLGRVSMDWEPASDAPLAPGEAIPVDRATYTALVELRSPSTVRSLINLLDAPRLEKIAAEAVADLGLNLPLDAVLTPFLETHRLLALEGLPAITRVNHGDDVLAWRHWWRQHHADAPPQVTPAGWGC